MIYGYLRVSTDEQDTDNQKQGIIKFLEYKGWTCDEFVVEHGVSGKIDYQERILGRLVKKLVKGDWLIVSELSRLSRSMINTFELVKELSLKGVSVYCVKEGITINTDPLGLMVLSAFAFAAETERQRISQRTKESLARLKKQGVKLGRPFGKAHAMLKLDNTKDYIIDCLNNDESIKGIARKINVSYSTFSRWLIKNNIYTPRLAYFSGKKYQKKQGRKKKVLMLPKD